VRLYRTRTLTIRDALTSVEIVILNGATVPTNPLSASRARSMNAVNKIGESAVTAIERQQWLDAPGYKLEHGVALIFITLGRRGRGMQDLLHGAWLGHPLHPALVDVPLGAWTAALVFDAADCVSTRPDGWRQAAQLAVGIGVLGGAGAALTGLTDWQHTHDEARRSGLVHGLLNSAALGLNLISWRQRRNGRHALARQTSALGYCLVQVASYLGGNLVFRHRIGVDHSQQISGRTGFVAVMPEIDLAEDTPHHIDCDGVDIVLIRHNGRINAVGGQCSHLGAPMSQGWLYRGELVCPWHGSRFDPRSGCATTGPATAPLTRYDVRIAAGQIEVREATATSSSPPDGPAAPTGAPR
jgi:nitrite reductase/ring-hydroxylating ferredoxin subunit/uncharacterized membrane protein